MRDGWDESTLGAKGVDVLDCVHATPMDAGSGYPYIAIPNIRDGKIELSGVRRITEQDLTKWTTRYRPSGGDVLVTRRGRVGDSAAIPEGLDCAIGQNLVILRSDGSSIDQGFLRYWALSPEWWADVDRWLNVGAVFDSLNVSDLPRFRITVPPLHEQRAIAGVLGALDDLIDTNQRLARDCSHLASDLAYSVDERTPVSTIASAGRETASPSGLIDHYSLPAFDSAGLPDRVDGSSVKSRKTLLPAPAALVSRLNPHIPRVWMAYPQADVPALASTEFVPLIGSSDPTEFIWATCASPEFLRQMAQHVTGTTGSHQRVDKDAILQMVVPDPIALGRDKVSAVAALVKCAHSARLEAQQATSTRDELLPLLMSGAVSPREVAP